MAVLQKINSGTDFLFNKMVRFFLPVEHFLKKENQNWKSFFRWYFFTNAMAFLFIFQFPDFFGGMFLKDFFYYLALSIAAPVCFYFYFKENSKVAAMTENSYFSTSKPKPKISFSYLVNSIAAASYWLVSIPAFVWFMVVLLFQFYIMDHFAIKLFGFSPLLLFWFFAIILIYLIVTTFQFSKLEKQNSVKKITSSIAIFMFKVFSIITFVFLILVYYFVLAKAALDFMAALS